MSVTVPGWLMAILLILWAAALWAVLLVAVILPALDRLERWHLARLAERYRRDRESLDIETPS